jgi:hypothetical protein
MYVYKKEFAARNAEKKLPGHMVQDDGIATPAATHSVRTGNIGMLIGDGF